jgi:hypothetical protein
MQQTEGWLTDFAVDIGSQIPTILLTPFVSFVLGIESTGRFFWGGSAWG